MINILQFKNILKEIKEKDYINYLSIVRIEIRLLNRGKNEKITSCDMVRKTVLEKNRR